MFTMRDDSLHRPSDRAEQAFRQQTRFNRIIFVLMVIIALLGVWNIFVLVSIIREGAVDLAKNGTIMDHLSSRLIILTSLVTLSLYLYKEWKWGEGGFAMAFFLAPLLFLGLVPVMSAEVEPAEEPMQVKFTLNQCEPGAIEGGEVLDSSLCVLVDPAETTVYMTASDPMDGEPDWLTPDAQDSIGFGWNVEARGKFRVYFLLEQESVEQCESSAISTSVSSRERHGHHCLERDGQVWLVQAYETSSVEGGRLTMYQEIMP